MQLDRDRKIQFCSSTGSAKRREHPCTVETYDKKLHLLVHESGHVLFLVHYVQFKDEESDVQIKTAQFRRPEVEHRESRALIVALKTD